MEQIVKVCPMDGAYMAKGYAMRNTLEMGLPDFPGNNEHSRGQTYSMTGPPKLVSVWKCPKCGQSVVM